MEQPGDDQEAYSAAVKNASLKHFGMFRHGSNNTPDEVFTRSQSLRDDRRRKQDTENIKEPFTRGHSLRTSMPSSSRKVKHVKFGGVRLGSVEEKDAKIIPSDLENSTDYSVSMTTTRSFTHRGGESESDFDHQNRGEMLPGPLHIDNKIKSRNIVSESGISFSTTTRDVDNDKAIIDLTSKNMNFDTANSSPTNGTNFKDKTKTIFHQESQQNIHGGSHIHFVNKASDGEHYQTQNSGADVEMEVVRGNVSPKKQQQQHLDYVDNVSDKTTTSSRLGNVSPKKQQQQQNVDFVDNVFDKTLTSSQHDETQTSSGVVKKEIGFGNTSINKQSDIDDAHEQHDLNKHDDVFEDDLHHRMDDKTFVDYNNAQQSIPTKNRKSNC